VRVYQSISAVSRKLQRQTRRREMTGCCCITVGGASRTNKVCMVGLERLRRCPAITASHAVHAGIGRGEARRLAQDDSDLVSQLRCQFSQPLLTLSSTHAAASVCVWRRVFTCATDSSSLSGTTTQHCYHQRHSLIRLQLTG